MASRRLAISSLLCADDQPNYPPPSEYAQRPSASPLSPSHTSALSSHQPSTPAEELIGDRPKGTSGLDATSALIASHESPSRDVVPLSLQPVQLRRHTPPSDDEARLPQVQPRTGHDPHVSNHIEGSTDAVRRSTSIPHHYELSSYHSRGPHLLAEASNDDFASHPPEFSHDLFAKNASHGNSYPSARPSSSRSAQSDSPSHPNSYAKPSPHLRASHSPSHSSPSSYSLPLPQRQSSHSPVLSVRGVTASPVNYFQPVGQTRSIYAGITSHHQSGSSSIHSPVLTGPGMSPSHFSSQQLAPVRTLQTHSTHQMIPQLVDQSSGVRTALASTPKVTTAASPTTRLGEGLGGLEALAQVATEERSRLSGEATSSNQVGERISPLISRSPVSARTVTKSPVIPQPELKSSSPTSSREALDLCGHSSSVTTDELSSASVVPCTDGEPPRKKHRKSGAYSPRSSAVELSPVVLCEHAVPLMDNPPPVSSPGALRSAGGPLKQNTGIHSGGLGGHLVTETSTGRATFVDDPSVGEEHPHQAANPLPSDGGRGNNITGSHEAQEKKEKKRRERPPPKTAAHSASKDHGKRVTVHENASREEDPHDWLLEQYSAASPPGTTAQITRTDEQTSQLHSSNGANSAMDELAMRHSSGRDASRSPDKPKRNPIRTPTPSALLEELDGIIHSHQPSRNDVARDVDMEFDVAASVSSPHAKEMDDLMDIDVDNELLSLLDDQPHESHSSRHKRSQQVHKRSKSSHSSSVVIVAYPDRSFPDGLSADDRDSMPPPASPSKDESKGTFESMSAASTHKKKDALPKPAPKSKAPPKSKEKSTNKAKPKNNKDAVGTAVPGYLAPSVSTAMKSKKTPGPSNAGVKRTGSTAAGPSRSRSTSIMPGSSVGPDTDIKGQPNEVEEKESERDDKLYCICKTGYDEDRVMIACDRCDEWYHTQCVNMPDLEVDLVDQFICPICIENNPGLNLKTTYKRRCLYGLEHPDPTSASACHKPARGIFSKFCSDECGILCMQSRMNGWQGDKHRLWESVKESQKREGVVVRVLDDTCARTKPERRGQDKSPRDQDLSLEVVQVSVMKGERETARLHGQLHKIAKRRDELKKNMEVVLWREKLVRLASERADGLDECGWDQRLCFDEEEYAEFGAGALDSYKEVIRRADEDDADAMTHDNMQAEHGEWWCKGKKKCDRHAGWQKMRLAEIEYEREVQEKALSRLTAEEREIRKKIEDGMDVGARGAQMASPTTPLQPLNGAATVNGHPQMQTNGDAVKKGKKKKH